MIVQRNVRERVYPVKSEIRQRNPRATIAAPAAAIAALFFLGIASTAQAALETAAKEANTSIGVLPTNTTNKWKLITDPAITTPAPSNAPDGETIDPMDYLVIGGILENTYNATEFHLLKTDDDTGTYATGVSVEGILPYEVTAFDVVMNGGGSLDVAVDPSNPAVDTITPDTTHGTVSGGEAGIVDNITFSLIGDLRSEALTADQDEDFFDLVLIDNPGYSGPPTQGMVEGGPNGIINLGPTDPSDPTIVPITLINAQEVPEPQSASLLLLGAGLLGLRRRIARV